MKDIPEYEQFYSINENGTVFSKRSRLELKPYKDRGGYSYVTLTVNRLAIKKKIHRLVAITFIPNPESKPQVNHIDGVKSNNHVSNLEWSTPGENQKHAFRIGLKKGKSGSSNPSWIANVAQYDLSGNLIKTWDSLRQIMRETGFDKSPIAKHIRGDKNYTHAYGFKWAFV